ncbi:MAG: hypothetical protein MUQ25_09240, partial [Candidatus Aminicenantes bacterium]|nr:hypothetical protein [Candidatus Aminicenantes bacterium]
GMGGNVKCLALYALGRFYLDEGQADLALDTWKSIDPTFSTWTLTKIRQAMTDRRNPARVISEVSYILDAEAATDRTRLLERVEKFNKWKKR